MALRLASRIDRFERRHTWPPARLMKRSLPLRSNTDHGGLSIGMWLISHDGSHVLQYRKASVFSPPTGSSIEGLITTDTEQPQTSLV
jgi:hypothetical protein